MHGNIQFVEFVGGPLDGYRREVPYAPASLAQELELDITANTFRVMAGLPRTPAAVATSTVVYELARADGLPRYYFIGAVKPLAKRVAGR
jgi:hypothetical protein